MQKPLILKSSAHRGQRGVTILLVAAAMVAIIGMAALSIDVITLYLAKEEAQRSANEAALAAARILSLSGITGDPGNLTGNWGLICGPEDGTNGLAGRAAKGVVAQNTIAHLAATNVDVAYSAGSNGVMGSATSDCTTLSSTAFGVNPLVTVKVTRASLPSFFSRIWGNPGQSITASATAEAFNPSNSGNVGNQTTGGAIIPVKPWCVKPWVVANQDPWNPAPSGGFNCNRPGGPGACSKIVDTTSGQIIHPGITTAGTGANGIIGETFWLVSDCQHINPNKCDLRLRDLTSGPEVQPKANFNNNSTFIKTLPANLLYLPGQVGPAPALAVPSCTTGDPLNEAIVGCDQTTNYSCGVQPSQASIPNAVDLTGSPDLPTQAAASCLIHQADQTNITTSSGQDYLSQTPLGAPAAYPFQIFSGSGNPVIGSGGIVAGTPITSSPSIVSVPIYDDTTATAVDESVTNVTFVGFLQVFINAIDANGNILVTVLNVSGCGGGASAPADPVGGTSPVPIRLITPP
jgi:hypothetical protein